MFSTQNVSEKYNQVRRSYCFYIDVQDHGLSASISRKLQDMGLQQEIFLTPRVTHVIRDRTLGVAPGSPQTPSRWRREAGRARADAMLERVRPTHQTHQISIQEPYHNCILLTVQKALNLLDRLYDTFFSTKNKTNVKIFSKHFIKIEFLDKVCRPIYKEFDEWPTISIDPDPPVEKKEPQKNPLNNIISHTPLLTTGQKMTRKSRPRIKEKEEKETKGGYCEMCNTDYVDAALHRRSQTHLTFVRDHTNFLGLDTLIEAGTDVTTFLHKTTGINGERRSSRKMCNGDVDPIKNKRSKSSQSPDSTINDDQSPKRNGILDEEKRHRKCTKKSSDSQISEDRQYYKVVGVSTKLRSSSGFAPKRKDSEPNCNGAKPLVVKFRKIRRSELSVLSDEAEQFMFPKRASSTSSISSDDVDNCVDDKHVKEEETKPKSPIQPVTLERRRQARPIALKEESSEEDSWIEDKKRRKRRTPACNKRTRKISIKGAAAVQSIEQQLTQIQPENIKPLETVGTPQVDTEIKTNHMEPLERCMKWEDGKLKYTPVVEQLEFAFELVPHSEPWYETFKRQDQDKIQTKNVPKYFALYSNSPKLPYEIGQLPPLKPNCCPLSDLVKREDKPGPSRSYGTRGMKRQRIKKRTAAILALENHPRKSPREHASTLAILGSAGLNRRRHIDDTKSTASEDTISDIHSNIKIDTVLSETHEESERLQQFLSEVFDDSNEYDVPEDVLQGQPALTISSNAPDVLSLVSECEDCDIIRKEIKEHIPARSRGKKGKFKKKNKTGWPNKRKQVKKCSRTSSLDLGDKASSLDRSSAEPDDESTQTITSEKEDLVESEQDKTLIFTVAKVTAPPKCDAVDIDISGSRELKVELTHLEDEPLQLDLKIMEEKEDTKNLRKPEPVVEKRSSQSSLSDSEDREEKMRRRKRLLLSLTDWRQPIVRVARVDPNAARRLRSAGRKRTNRSCR